MDTFESIAARRSVKHFEPGFSMPEGDVQKLLQAALLSPTSFNIQNWRIVRVSDPALKAQVRELAWGQAQVTDCSLLLVLCADLKAWDKDPARYWRNAGPEVQSLVVSMIGDFYRGKPDIERDEVMRSCGMAAQTLMLGAKALGYDSCPMIGFDYEALGKLIKLPADHQICMMLAIGKPAQPAAPRGGQLALDEVVFENSF